MTIDQNHEKISQKIESVVYGDRKHCLTCRLYHSGTIINCSALFWDFWLHASFSDWIWNKIKNYFFMIFFNIPHHTTVYLKFVDWFRGWRPYQQEITSESLAPNTVIAPNSRFLEPRKWPRIWNPRIRVQL